LTGDATAVENVRKKFAEMGKLEVHVLEPDDLNVAWQHAGETPNTQMAAVLGTALTLNSDINPMPGPNLIEGTLAQLRAPVRPILLRCLAPIAAVILVAATLMVLHLVNLRQIATLRTELVEMEPVIARATELRLRLTAAEVKLTQLDKLEKKLRRTDWQRLLTRVSQSMPEDVWLDRLVVRDGENATFGGASFTDSGVYDFVSYLKEVPDVAEIALESTGVSQNDSGPTTTFDLKATLAEFNAGANRGTRDE
jgi:hypothetical protein